MSDLDTKHFSAHHENAGDVELDSQNGSKVLDNVAAGYVDPTVEITLDDHKRLKRMVFTKLLPVMCVAYVTQALDKGALSPASIMGWQTHVHAVGQDYALTSTLLYVGIIIGEPIINQGVRKFPVAKLLGWSMVAWTILMFALTFTLHIHAVFAIRALLGFFESSFNPCLVAITVQWFTVEEQVMITTIWQTMFALANLVAALLGFGFYQLHGASGIRTAGLYTWQWMLLTISIISGIASFVVLFFLPDSPVNARWATADDKVKFIERVRKNDQGIKQKKWRSEQAWEVVKDPLPWLLFTMIFCQTLIVGGLNTFNSLLINKAFGFSVSVSQLLGIPLAAFQVMLYFLIGWTVTKTKQTVFCMIGYVCINIIGTVVLLVVAPGAKTKGGLLVCFYLMQCMQSVSPCMWSLLSRNIAGQTKKSIVYALFFVGWAGGNAVGPQLFQAKWAPRYRNTLYIHLGIYGIFILDLLVIRWHCSRRNRQRDAMMAGQVNAHTAAFEDRTDVQNVEFRYSY